MHIQKNTCPNQKNKTASRRILQWTAVLCLALSLTGCAREGSDERNDSSYVFETQFHSPEGGVEDFTVSGDSIYYTTFQGEFYQWIPGGEAQKIGIEPFEPEADSRVLQADHQGNLYVFYHVPESRTGSDSDASYLVKYDAAGKELSRKDISRFIRGFSVHETAVDGEGRLFVMGMDRLLLFDGECSYTEAAEVHEDEHLIWLAEDDRGHVYCCLSSARTGRGLIREAVYGGEESEEEQSASPDDSGSALLESAGSTTLGEVTGEFQAGNHLAVYGENRFLTSADNCLYLYDAAAQTQTVLLQWADCDINPDSVRSLATLADGRIAVLLQEEAGAGELALVTEIPKDQTVQKEIITLGVLHADNSHLLRCVSRFNRNSSDCRIEIKEYYNALLHSGQPEAEEEARTALHLDISSGNCPDILVLEYDDLETYASKGLLEDLNPHLKENGQLALSDNVVDAYTFYGKLCALPGALQIRTIVGCTGNLGQLGDAGGWTLEEMMDFMDSNSDKTVFSADAGQLLEYSIVFNQPRFVDQETHTCDFTSGEFIRLLEFCGRFSGKEPYEDNGVLDLVGKGNNALLHEVELVRPEDVSLLMQVLGSGDISYVGFPTVDGRAGSLLEDCGGTCAISAKSKHKEEAWDFLELLLTGWENPPKSFAALLGTKGFPTELGTRARYFTEVTENPYSMREDGEILTENGEPVRYFGHSYSANGMQVRFYVPLSQETDLICGLLDLSMTAHGSRQILSIVSQEAQAYFSGQKSAADVAAVIQNRVSVYLEEQD